MGITIRLQVQLIQKVQVAVVSQSLLSPLPTPARSGHDPKKQRTGARVMTSSQFLAQIEEKERQKKKEAAEKEQRRKER